ncbi:MAG: SOS response-associated peptidase [Bacteroidetes bacterium]|nr:SOS response-associated peptidase [Bacteroidota bacterium]
MCFHSKQSKSAQELKHRFQANIKDDNLIQPSVYNGFQYPKTPVITNKQPNEIQLYAWGLIPFWAKDNSIRKNTLNAKIETIHQKPSFRNVINNRCLVLADGFYEWQWLDPKGKQKQKYELTLPDHETFAFAGLWSEWIDKSTGEIIYTYTILTTEANELMSKIHNTKKRMPIILSQDNEQDWLKGENLIMQNDRIQATEV